MSDSTKKAEQPLLDLAFHALNAAAHSPQCSFTACNCGAVEEFKPLRAEFMQRYLEVIRGK